MDLFSINFWLYGGIVLMAAAVAAGVISAVLLHASGKRLEKKYQEEYGDRRH